jgi:hypothetical protein
MTAKTLSIKKTRILSAYIAMAVCAALILPQQNASAAADSGMRLTIGSDKGSYKKEEPVSINFKLKNTGKKEAYINNRFYVTSEEAKDKAGEVYFIVTSPSGEKVPGKVSYETGMPKTDYFVIIKPGEEMAIERKPSLNYFFDFAVPGDYKITAVYQNKYGKEIGLDVFSERIESNQITIKRAD